MPSDLKGGPWCSLGEARRDFGRGPADGTLALTARVEELLEVCADADADALLSCFTNLGPLVGQLLDGFEKLAPDFLLHRALYNGLGNARLDMLNRVHVPFNDPPDDLGSDGQRGIRRWRRRCVLSRDLPGRPNLGYVTGEPDGSPMRMGVVVSSSA